jgi:hypothetical protein
MNDIDGIGDDAKRMVAESKGMDRTKKIIGNIQRHQSAEAILAVIVKELRGAPIGWANLDVDDRNALISGWRAKIISELEAYF